jgi:hypothetical protein
MGLIFSLDVAVEGRGADAAVPVPPSLEIPLKLTDLPINRSLLQFESGIDTDADADDEDVPLVMLLMLLLSVIIPTWTVGSTNCGCVLD